MFFWYNGKLIEPQINSLNETIFTGGKSFFVGTALYLIHLKSDPPWKHLFAQMSQSKRFVSLLYTILRNILIYKVTSDNGFHVNEVAGKVKRKISSELSWSSGTRSIK